MVLEEVFRKLNDSEHCRYNTNTECLGFIGDDLLKIRAPELIEVFSQNRTELVTMAYFGNESTRLAYQGLDIKQMLITIADLRLASISENIVENAFSSFEGILSDEIKKNKYLPCFVEQKFIPGSERHLVFIFEKLISIYEKDVIMLSETPLVHMKR